MAGSKAVWSLLVFFLTFSLFSQAQDYPRQSPLFQKKIDIEFKGGTLSELMEQVKKKLDGIPNIYLTKYARNTEMPPLSLKGISVYDFIAALQTLGFHSHLNISCIFAGNIAVVRRDQVGIPIYKRKNIRIFYIEDIIASKYFKEKISVKDIVTAMEKAWKLSGGTMPIIKYHPSLRIIIVYGEKDKLDVAESIISHLRESKNTEKSLSLEAELRKKIADIAKELEELEKKVDKIQSKLHKNALKNHEGAKKKKKEKGPKKKGV